MNIEVSVNTAQVSRYLLDLAANQIPYAGALALTRTAQQGQGAVQRVTPSRFTLRNQWVTKGVRITAARKNNLQSSVYSKDDFMGLQEGGGTKRPKGHNLAIPTSNARRNKRDIISKANRPRSLADKPTFFIGEVKGITGLWKRPPGRQQRAARKKGGWGSPKLMFAFRSQAKINKRWGFVETVGKVAAERLDANFDAALKDALK